MAGLHCTRPLLARMFSLRLRGVPSILVTSPPASSTMIFLRQYPRLAGHIPKKSRMSSRKVGQGSICWNLSAGTPTQMTKGFKKFKSLAVKRGVELRSGKPAVYECLIRRLLKPQYGVSWVAGTFTVFGPKTFSQVGTSTIPIMGLPL